jgi:hypothetical protein
MSRHPDFEKIHATFMQHYSKEPALGEERYAEWLAASGLDETKGYYAQAAERAKSHQSFGWAKFLLQLVKEDKDARYYKVEALFAVESMNLDSPPFTRDEVLQSARSLTGKPSNFNHDAATFRQLADVEIVAAQCEDECVECLVRVPKTSLLIGMIDRGEIVSVSIEGEWSHGLPGCGLVLTGLAWLTKNSTLPAMPLTRIVAVEQMVESFEVRSQVLEHLRAGGFSGKAKLRVKELLEPLDAAGLSCVFCGAPGEYLVTVCTSCGDNAAGAVSLGVHGNGSEILEEKDMDKIAEKVAAKVGEKESVILETLKADLTVANAKVSEAENKAKAAEGLQAKLTEMEGKLAAAEGKLTEANNTVEKIKQFVPGVDLLANPPKLMPVSECLERLGRLELSKMQERLSLGNQVQAQKVHREIFEVKQKYGVA